MRVKIPRYYRPDQLEDRDIYLSMQWWSQEQRDALRALHAEEDRIYREKLRPLDRKIALETRIARLERFLKTFNPDQPRVPAGQPDGGQWTGDTSATDATDDDSLDVGGGDGGDDGDEDDMPDAGKVDTPPKSDVPPTQFRTVNDTSGTEPWSQRIDGFSADGQLMTQRFDNRDGSTIVAEYNPTGQLPYDSQFIVSTPDGGRYTFTNVGDTQTVVDDITTQVVSVSRLPATDPLPNPSRRRSLPPSLPALPFRPVRHRSLSWWEPSRPPSRSTISGNPCRR